MPAGKGWPGLLGEPPLCRSGLTLTSSLGGWPREGLSTYLAISWLPETHHLLKHPSYLRLMQSGGRTSVAEAPSWVSTEKTWPRSRQATSSLPSTPRHVTENSTLVSRLHNSSSGVSCGDRKVVWTVGCGLRREGIPAQHPLVYLLVGMKRGSICQTARLAPWP